MESMINDTMNAMKDAIDVAREGGEQAMGAAKRGTKRAVSTTRSTYFDAVHAVADVVSVLRRLDGDEVLGWFGLARRRRPFAAVAAFGVGIVVGAGVGVMLAPSSGVALRRQLLERFAGLKDDAKATVEHAAANVREAAEKAGDTVKQAEQKIENEVAAAADDRKRANEAKADGATRIHGSGTHRLHHG
jgi:gas vesicle protein